MAKKITINGFTYAYETIGQGTPLILLHGFTGSKETWRPFFDLWKDAYQVIAIDLPGHGQTDHPDALHRYRMESVCRDLDALINTLQLPSVNLLGYSMGGRVALSFTCLYPDRVKKLVLESSSPGLEQRSDREKRMANDERLAQMIEEKGIAFFVNYWENIPLFRTQKTLPFHLRQRLREERLAQHPRGLANSLRGMGTGVQPSWWGQLHNISIPVQLIVGERDGKFCEIAQRMKNILPNANYLEVKGAGHAIHVEKGEIFGKIVMDFLKIEEGTY
ncbi:2-succinyl-6-hydroxy-2,4-cyclohexadiene-1-carboxylate synthase [Fervidibacillus albus]|uniref:Putative 2-succinyl-6-hydroxy-2,4-cyclohexadiene-1-carboxylate synthase n=1 Tax=Fervidibacillus albus TaxID=2980026 RepID=A0A9E8LUQ8_9BACI|nr:2-succinyl-6-hydroxy-2,4-cyclohexadiene-1-carboxylate synthase [Fervidibacillus albus]WAA10045.1 2-succinyl-6-hydroxy-2,4-cyclohexadiene-1-carboxylate synthase [Fervidibacillus albus]